MRIVDVKVHHHLLRVAGYEQGLVHAPTAPGIGFEAHWGDIAPWESGPLVE